MPTHEPEGRDDGLVGREDLDEAPDQRDRLPLVAGVEVHLAAAGLLPRELDLVPEALEQLDRGPPGLGKKGVVEAGDKQRYAHAATPSPESTGPLPGAHRSPN